MANHVALACRRHAMANPTSYCFEWPPIGHSVDRDGEGEEITQKQRPKTSITRTNYIQRITINVH